MILPKAEIGHRQVSIIDKGMKHDADISPIFSLCGYSNCFRNFYKLRGFMPCCEFHYKHPQKWGKDGMTFTGSTFIKKDVRGDLSLTLRQNPSDFSEG